MPLYRELTMTEYPSVLGDNLGLCVFIVRPPGQISTTFRPVEGDTIEKCLRELYANHPGAQIDVLRIWSESLGCMEIEDGEFYLAGLEAMKFAPEYDPDDDD